MHLIKPINLTLAFLLELYAIGVLGYWGFTLQSSQAFRVAAGLLAPTALIIIWGIWCAPSSIHRLEGLWLLLMKSLLFGLVALSLLNLKLTLTAAVFVILVILNLSLSVYGGTL